MLQCIYFSIYLFINLFFMNLSTSSFTSVSIRLSICLSGYLSINHECINLWIYCLSYLSLYLYFCQSFYLLKKSTYLSIYPGNVFSVKVLGLGLHFWLTRNFRLSMYHYIYLFIFINYFSIYLYKAYEPLIESIYLFRKHLSCEG